MAETSTATLDRIVDGQTAVLLLEEDDETEVASTRMSPQDENG